MELQLLESVMVILWIGLASATVVAYRARNDQRDVRLLAALTALWGMGTATAVVAT